MSSINTFLLSLGEAHPSQKILDAIIEIGSGFIEYKSPTSCDYYYEFFNDDVSFNFSNNYLSQITIYCEAKGNYRAFTSKIFNKINNNANSQEVENIFGKPRETGGNINIPFLSKINLWWKYKIYEKSMIFEFNDDFCISAIHLLN